MLFLILQCGYVNACIYYLFVSVCIKPMRCCSYSVGPDAGIKIEKFFETLSKMQQEQFSFTQWHFIYHKSCQKIWVTFVRNLLAKTYKHSPIWSHFSF